MSYGPDFLSKEKDKRRTIKAKQLRGRAAVEEEGIVTSRLPAYTDILKIRFEIIYGFIGFQVIHKIILNRKMYNCKIPKVRGCNPQSRFQELRHLAGSSCVRVLRYEITLLLCLTKSHLPNSYRKNMAFGGAEKNCPRVTKGARMYEPRDYEVVLACYI